MSKDTSISLHNLLGQASPSSSDRSFSRRASSFFGCRSLHSEYVDFNPMCVDMYRYIICVHIDKAQGSFRLFNEVSRLLQDFVEFCKASTVRVSVSSQLWLWLLDSEDFSLRKASPTVYRSFAILSLEGLGWAGPGGLGPGYEPLRTPTWPYLVPRSPALGAGLEGCWGWVCGFAGLGRLGGAGGAGRACGLRGLDIGLELGGWDLFPQM